MVISAIFITLVGGTDVRPSWDYKKGDCARASFFVLGKMDDSTYFIGDFGAPHRYFPNSILKTKEYVFKNDERGTGGMYIKEIGVSDVEMDDGFTETVKVFEMCKPSKEEKARWAHLLTALPTLKPIEAK